MKNTASYTVTGLRVEPEYSDEYETVCVIDLKRNDGETGDVWIVAGVRPQDRGTVQACGTQAGFRRAWLYGDSRDCWCPASFANDDADAILEACQAAAIKAPRDERVNG